jgi:hypothetical protein
MITITQTSQNPMLADDELARLHSDDLHAAKLVVGLIGGVFLIGLLLYSAIFLIVW